jgi:hypothetical protein
MWRIFILFTEVLKLSPVFALTLKSLRLHSQGGKDIRAEYLLWNEGIFLSHVAHFIQKSIKSGSYEFRQSLCILVAFANLKLKSW